MKRVPPVLRGESKKRARAQEREAGEEGRGWRGGQSLDAGCDRDICGLARGRVWFQRSHAT